jgi:hypothetical protein
MHMQRRPSIWTPICCLLYVNERVHVHMRVHVRNQAKQALPCACDRECVGLAICDRLTIDGTAQWQLQNEEKAELERKLGKKKTKAVRDSLQEPQGDQAGSAAAPTYALPRRALTVKRRERGMHAAQRSGPRIRTTHLPRLDA